MNDMISPVSTVLRYLSLRFNKLCTHCVVTDKLTDMCDCTTWHYVCLSGTDTAQFRASLDVDTARCSVYRLQCRPIAGNAGVHERKRQ